LAAGLQADSSLKGISGSSNSFLPFTLFNFEEYSQWQAAVLHRLESLETLIAILVLVLLMTTYSLYELIQHSGNKDSNLFRTLDLVVSIIFISELTLRLYCSAVINKGLVIFFSSSLNILDTLVVLLDIILLAIGTESGQAVSFAKSVFYLPSPLSTPLPPLDSPVLCLSQNNPSP
jgi:hypothetical protein